MNIDNRELKKWQHVKNAIIIEAATEKWNKYPPEIQITIETEAKQRGFWDYILYLRGNKPIKPITPDGILEGFVCENCKGIVLNPQTGRCARCNMPPGDFGYCKKCDKFWSTPPGQTCPEDNTKLIPFKAVTTTRRVVNLILDNLICAVLAIPLLVSGAPLLREANFNNELDIRILFICLFSIYYFIFEALWQRTPAKFITGTKVITYTGQKPTVKQILIRTLVRFVPFVEPFTFLGARVRGLHDRWSGTYVIRKSIFASRNADFFFSDLLQKSEK